MLCCGVVCCPAGVLQGMNFLVGLLLVAVDRDCERCFWLLLVLLEKVGTAAAALRSTADSSEG